MTHKSTSILTAGLLFLSFCIFVTGYENFARNRAHRRIKTHAHIIKDAMWSYNNQGIDEYLKLAALSDKYLSLTVIHQNGELFHKTIPKALTPIDKLLISSNLIPKIPLQAAVLHQGEIIGQIKGTWQPRTIYTHINVFLAMVSFFIIIQLYHRLLRAKSRLEERVVERTAELEASNMELKKEIDERSRAEKALRTSEMKYRFLSENIKDIIWTLDMDLNFTYMSPAAFYIHNWDDAYRSTLTLSKALTRASFRQARDYINTNLAQAREVQDYSATMAGEFEVVNKDGSTMFNEMIASFIMDENNTPTGILGVFRDITHRRQAEAEKAKLIQRLERSKKMESLGLLAGGVAHDLNNVLAGIVSYPDLLLMELPENSPMCEPVKIIKESGQKAAAIVEDLLTLARRGVKTNEALNINDILNELQHGCDYHKLHRQYPHVEIRFDLDDNLPNSQGSAVHLNKTFMNLIINAAEAQTNGGEIRITTKKRYLDQPIRGYSAINAKDYVHLQIKDCGQGISKTDINHIFEPFYTKKKMGCSGTGLGLAVVWGTVEDHKGYIDVHSDPGKGTTFDLYFPISTETVREKDAPFNLREVQGNGERILVVDDQKSVRTIAASLLHRLNYSAIVAESGEAAVEYLKHNTVDLVILDMIMEPGMDGLSTWQQIIGIHPGLRAIIASGYAETQKVKAAQRMGAGAYLKKPYMIESLGKEIKKALG